ncbi:MAG: hypothetical protein ACRDRL_33350 [Sciscionella sp.]
MLVGAFTPMTEDATTGRLPSVSRIGIAGGYAIGAIGLGCLVAGVVGLAALGNSSSTAPIAAPVSVAAAPALSAAPVFPTSAMPVVPPVTSTTTTSPADPSSVIRDYFSAINRGDYRQAWKLGGSNLDASYTHFAKGFAHTAHDTWSVTRVSGDTVHGNLRAAQADGTTQYYSGYYTVKAGAITSANLRVQSAHIRVSTSTGCAAAAMAVGKFDPSCAEYQGYLDPGTRAGRAPNSGDIHHQYGCKQGYIPKSQC